MPLELHEDINGEDMDIYIVIALLLYPTTGKPLLLGEGRNVILYFGKACMAALICAIVVIMQFVLPFYLLRWYQPAAGEEFHRDGFLGKTRFWFITDF